jgi:hypothetical protein
VIKTLEEHFNFSILIWWTKRALQVTNNRKPGDSAVSSLMLHRTRQLFILQQTAVINSIRAHLAEFGIE